MRASVISCVFLLLVTGQIGAVERPTDSEIEALVTENLAATQANDIDALLATIHPDSPARTNLPPMLESLTAYKLRYVATVVEFVCMQGDYALVQVTQQTARIAGPDFLDNEIDGTWALRLDGSDWKYWGQMILTFRPLEQGSQ